MEFEIFRERLRTAVIAARDFARPFVLETLPDPILYRVTINSAYQGYPFKEGERVYPGDTSCAFLKKLSQCSEEQVLAALWRNGEVPCWIDVSVDGETGTATVIELTACGRFTANNDLIYPPCDDRQPFRVKGPGYLNEIPEDRLVSLYQMSKCWYWHELERVAINSEKVCWLDLMGDEFDDQTLTKLPVLPIMKYLNLRDSPIDGSGLKQLAQQPKLERLYIKLLQNPSFTIEYLPKLHRLYKLELLELPNIAFNINKLFQQAPALDMVTVKSDQELQINGECPGYLHTLDLMTPQLSGTIVLPRELKYLTLRLPNLSSHELEQLLAPVENVEILTLLNTPITEELMSRLAAFNKLEYLGLLDTGLDYQFIRNLRIKYPKLRINAGKYDLDLDLGIVQ